ncbi:hypothetical protein FE257_006634 [Aspergillus nanangensis]|uniref:pyridoxal 5'-phosphate synthase n=1 Tax=Aspergillus nanangensis TaxID=2582783 RepID=A0AAD4CXX6_ASPNN|nr:hypothetical protein FE257_006634 [Aspergillus nanangensis]
MSSNAADWANSPGDEAKRPKKLIFAPGDIDPSITDASIPSAPDTVAPSTAAAHLVTESLRSGVSTPSSTTESQMVAHPARAHQFVSNPPLTVSQMHPTNPLHQFHNWFRDPRLLPSSAPETCTLATASWPSGRVSARVVYLKELDERGWVIYSNWGSREGKGGQVFGTKNLSSTGSNGDVPAPMPDLSGTHDEPILTDNNYTPSSDGSGNRWAALTFNWSGLERQVRVEGLIEPLSREESEVYWRTRERGSQIGAWASWQSKVLWTAEPASLIERRRKSLAQEVGSSAPVIPGDVDETDIDDGRAMLENRVREMEKKFDGVENIPLPPFWGGVRLVPESVEFWQGRRSRLHDRFRYVRGESQWRVQRLSP